MVRTRRSSRLDKLPPYLFAELERKQRELREAGKDVIDLSIGDPDQPAPETVRRALEKHLRDAEIDAYATTHGTDEFRDAVIGWMRRRYGVHLDRRNVLLCVGAKEVIAHAPLALTDPGDVVLIPEPGYPPYLSGTVFAHAEAYRLSLRRERGFLPDLDAVPGDVRKRAAVLYLNYPNNPTGAVATREFYEAAVRFARENDVLVISDAAYAEIYYDDPPISFLSVPGALEVGIEIHSMTKTMNMAGWRIAWAAGRADAIESLRSFKANCDSGQFKALQLAAAEGLNRGEEDMRRIREVYRQRRDAFLQELEGSGWDIVPPRATFYVWFPTPSGEPSIPFAERLLQEAHLVVTPGAGFGRAGEGFVRIALTEPVERLREAARRLRGFGG